MALILIGVGAALLYLAYRASPPVHHVCGCGDDVHDDPACSHYGKADE